MKSFHFIFHLLEFFKTKNSTFYDFFFYFAIFNEFFWGLERSSQKPRQKRNTGW